MGNDTCKVLLKIVPENKPNDEGKWVTYEAPISTRWFELTCFKGYFVVAVKYLGQEYNRGET